MFFPEKLPSVTHVTGSPISTVYDDIRAHITRKRLKREHASQASQNEKGDRHGP